MLAKVLIESFVWVYPLLANLSYIVVNVGIDPKMNDKEYTLNVETFAGRNWRSKK